MFISIQPIANPLLLVPVKLNLHLGHVLEAAFAEERIARGRGLDVAFHALAVGDVGAPLHELGAGAEALVRRVRVDDVEDCWVRSIGAFGLAFFFFS